MAVATLALSLDAAQTRIRLSYSEGDIARLTAAVDAAEERLAEANSRRPFRPLAADNARAALTAVEAELTWASAHVVGLANPGSAGMQAGDAMQVEDELVLIRRVDGDFIDVERGTLGTRAAIHAADVALFRVSPLGNATIEVLVDGAGAEIEPGDKAELVLPFRCRLERVRLLADQIGDAVVDIVRSTFADPPGSGVSITAAAKPELAAAARYDDEVLDGWTRELERDDVLGVVIEDAAGIERLTLVLNVATSVAL